MDTAFHEPVLRSQALDFLITNDCGVYVDGTVGGGGHAEGICTRLRAPGTLFCFDADGDAIAFARNRLERWGSMVTMIHANAGRLQEELSARGVGQITGMLLDLGVSSHQLDEPSRGFSFRWDDTLDMRMNRTGAVSAREIVNTYDEERLAAVLWKYGEERNSRRIAKRIVAARPVETTSDLRNVIELGLHGPQITKTLARVFQALRIEVNDELGNLRRALSDGMGMLAPGGRIVVIAYHSLEDRIVKEFFKAESALSRRSAHKYLPDEPLTPALRVLTRKPITPSDTEKERNPRARSARMRVAERLQN
jgi:16S rRNA (cytosine1402-N4)-methyltransferase